MKPPLSSRAITIVAIGFLLLDAALLGWLGIKLARPWLVVAAGACLVTGVFVVVAWRRYTRTLAELESARREMRREVQEIQELLRHRS